MVIITKDNQLFLTMTRWPFKTLNLKLIKDKYFLKERTEIKEQVDETVPIWSGYVRIIIKGRWNSEIMRIWVVGKEIGLIIRRIMMVGMSWRMKMMKTTKMSCGIFVRGTRINTHGIIKHLPNQIRTNTCITSSNMHRDPLYNIIIMMTGFHELIFHHQPAWLRIIFSTSGI